MPQQNYALDVAYQSDIAVMDASKPISMAYGFVLLSSGVNPTGNKGLGEKVDQSIDVGDTVVFSVFDTASSLAPVTSIVITSYDVTNPNVPADPFGWSPAGIYSLNGSGFGANGKSTGCNVQGFGLSTPQFTAQGKGQGKGQKKTYDFTITVTLQNGRVFQVDPEMDVEGIS